ncbi:alpha/beta fold hydrolase [Streptomyces sp. NPDC097619]|uniref:thioesterase II family protein n=1 Tax=Streptomyces sp. NPDC097619 TaxID=3157228 RepID=UPI0033272C64
MTPWLQCTTARPDAAQRLVCFPHAGGVPAFYSRWADGLPATEIHAVRYPGRAERTGEPCATDLHETAREIAEALRLVADRPLALFGHSMGAWIAFETARLLEADGITVSHLFASAAPAPQTRTAPDPDVPLDDDELTATLIGLGGTPAELLAEPVLLKLVFPYVNADFRMAGRYVYRPGPPLACPVTTLVGADDPVAGPHATEAWSRQTRGPYRGHTVKGDHFYLAEKPPFDLIQDLLAGWPEGRR